MSMSGSNLKLNSHLHLSAFLHGVVPSLLLALAVVVLYGQFLWNPIVFDDLPVFMLDNAGHQPVTDYRFSLLELRSLPYATLAWGKSLFGLDLLHFRVENLLLHSAVVIALFHFLSALLDVAYPERDQQGLSNKRAAFCAALLFALHPVATYAAGYLVQRSIVMATLFSLLALWAYLRGSVQQQPVWLWMSVPFYYLAVLSKEHAVVLPLALLSLTILLYADWRSILLQRWKIYACLILVATFVLLAKRGLIGSVYEIDAPSLLLQNNGKQDYLLSVLTQSKLYFNYLLLWVFPNTSWMSVDMREPFAHSVFSYYLLAFSAFLGWGISAVYLLLKRGKLGLCGFALLFPWLMFLTEFSTIRIQEEFVLYRSYLWLPITFVLLPMLFIKLPVRYVAIVVSVLVLVLMPLSMERLKVMSHPLLLWDDAEKLVNGQPDLPGAYRIYYNRGTELLKANQLDLAIADFKQAIVLREDYFYAYGNLGAAYLKRSEWGNAVDAFNRAIALAEKNSATPSLRWFLGRALAYEGMGDIEHAKRDYRVTCQLGQKACDKI